MGLFTGLFSGGAEGLLKGAGDIIGKFVEDPAKKDAANKELQEFLLKHEETMEQLAEQKYEAGLEDIQDARNREIQIANSKDAPLINKINLPILALFITAGFFGLLTYMLKYNVPTGNKDILNVMLGSLGTAWITVVSYYFGSSSGSKEKDETIKKLSS